MQPSSYYRKPQETILVANG